MFSLRRFLVVCVLAMTAAIVSAQPLRQPDNATAAFSFALIGDMPYSAAQMSQFDRVIDAINAESQVRFVMHAGDIKGGSERCDNALIEGRFAQLQKLSTALVYTIGDNEWTDCHRTNNGSYYPLERLSFVRRLFFPNPYQSTGQQPLAVTPQSAQPSFYKFVEHVMFTRNRVVFATLHVVGSNNDLVPWTGFDPSDSTANPRADRIAEFNERKSAVLAWIDQVFDAATATDAPGVFLLFQANPNFELATSNPERAGFNEILARLKSHALAFARPVVLAHGDNHEFIVDMPFYRDAEPAPKVPQFFRVQGFGNPRIHWIKVSVDPKSSGVFSIEPKLVPGNF